MLDRSLIALPLIFFQWFVFYNFSAYFSLSLSSSLVKPLWVCVHVGASARVYVYLCLSHSLISAASSQVKWWHEYHHFDGMFCQISVNTYLKRTQHLKRNGWIYVDWQHWILVFFLLWLRKCCLPSSSAIHWSSDEYIQLWLLPMLLSVITVVIVSVAVAVATATDATNINPVNSSVISCNWVYRIIRSYSIYDFILADK